MTDKSKKHLDNLNDQKVNTDNVAGGKTQPFNEFVDTKENEPANFMSDEKTTTKSRFNQKGSSVFSKRTDAKK